MHLMLSNNYAYMPIKAIIRAHYHLHDKVILMSTHNKDFTGELTELTLQLSLNISIPLSISQGLLNLSRVMRKPAFCICENKDPDQLCGNREADQRFVFATWIVLSLYFLNPEFQASNHPLWLHNPVCVGPGRKPRRPVF